MDSARLLLLGVSHRTAPLEVREALAFAPAQVKEALDVARRDGVLHESLILSTCNRTEVYALSADPERAEAYVRDLVRRLKGSDFLQPGPHRYRHQDRETVAHLFRVAAGVDSMVLGEPQILGQVKDALDLGTEGRAVGPFIGRLLMEAVRVGKRARAETEIGAGAVSVASAAVALTRKIFSDLAGKRVLVVGAGETGRLAARHFAEQRPAEIVIVNRTLERAESLAAELDGRALPLSALPEALARADVLVTATGSPGPLISAEHLRLAMRERGRRPMVVMDIAVPRDVDPAAARLDNVFLHSIDALRALVDQNLTRRRHAVPRVLAIVDEEVARFFDWVRALGVTPVVRALREHFESLREAELERHRKHFDPALHARLDALTRALVNKLLHQPTTAIKGFDRSTHEGLLRLDAARELFGLALAEEPSPETEGAELRARAG
ncbi:MAG TPA: glutamyl-tRNA reductase [Vicinamibacteria bacterium]